MKNIVLEMKSYNENVVQKTKSYNAKYSMENEKLQ